MIGNDVVDLHLANLENDWQRPRYLSKIFTQKEQSHIAAEKNKTEMVWRLWSMKEAAYKANQRRFGLFSKFNPTEFHCEPTSKENGIVRIGKENYETITAITSEFVGTVAKLENYTMVIHSRLERNIEPNELHVKLKKYLSLKSKQHISMFTIEKDKNHIPWIFKDGSRWEIPFSFSHHGKFSLFSLPD